MTSPIRTPSDVTIATCSCCVQQMHPADWKERMIAQLSQSRDDALDWRNAALRVGEEFAATGPDGYYDMTSEQWRDWALDAAIRKGAAPGGDDE